MQVRVREGRLDRVLRELAREALSREASEGAVRKAVEATRRALGDAHRKPSLLARRARAYFVAVVRREMMRKKSCARATARSVVASVVEDLSREGRSAADIWDELQRGWTALVPEDVLEEYRPREARPVAA